jgi:hypothetical protein
VEATTSVFPLVDFSGLAFMGIRRTNSSPTIFAEKAMDSFLGFDCGCDGLINLQFQAHFSH